MFDVRASREGKLVSYIAIASWLSGLLTFRIILSAVTFFHNLVSVAINYECSVNDFIHSLLCRVKPLITSTTILLSKSSKNFSESTV